MYKRIKKKFHKELKAIFDVSNSLESKEIERLLVEERERKEITITQAMENINHDDVICANCRFKDNTPQEGFVSIRRNDYCDELSIILKFEETKYCSCDHFQCSFNFADKFLKKQNSGFIIHDDLKQIYEQKKKKKK